MAEIINFGRARKARDRAAGQVQAAANRAKFGRTKDARNSDAAEATRRDAELDGAKRE